MKDVVIENNTWRDCANIQLCVGADNERTLPPTNVLVKNNRFWNKSKNEVYTAYDDISGFRFAGNAVLTKSGNFSKPGFIETKPGTSGRSTGGIEKSACGAHWYREPIKKARNLSGRKISITPSQNSILKAVPIASADVIELTSEGDYLVDNGVEINKYLRIQGAKELKAKLLSAITEQKVRQVFSA